MNAKKIILIAVPLALLLVAGLFLYLRQTWTTSCEAPFIQTIKETSLTLQNDPDNQDARINRAHAFYTLGWYHQALPDYTKAIDLGATDGTLFLNRARCIDPSKNSQQAIQDAERAIEILPEDPACYLRLGDIYRIQKEYKNALPVYQLGLELDPKHAGLHTSLARLYTGLKNVAAAERSFNTAVECESFDAYPHYRRGIFLAGQQKHQQAIDDFTRFIEAAPTCLTRRLQAHAYTRRHTAAVESGISGYSKNPIKAILLNLKLQNIRQEITEASHGKSSISIPVLFGYIFLLLGLMASFFLVIGISVVAKKKPLLLSSRWFFGIIALAFSFQIMNSIHQLLTMDSGGLSFALWITLIMYILLLGFLWIQMKGYILIGIFDDSFREALHFSLNQNNLPFEEKLSKVILTEENTELQVAIQSWIGAGQIKQRKPTSPLLMKKVIGGIDDYYSENSIKLNYTTPIFYIIFGLLLLIFAIAISLVLLLL